METSKQMKEQIEEMRKDLIEIFDEEYEKRRMIIPDFTAEKMTAKGYRKQEWISIKNTLPEKFDFYLVSIIDHFGLDFVTVLPYSNLFGFGSYEVTHWMPLPEPPKMKGGAE